MKKTSGIIILIVTICGSCSHLVSTKSRYFSVVNTTSTHWTAGTPDGGSGRDLNLFLKPKTDKKIIFDSIWVGNEGGILEMSIMKKDLIEVRTTILDTPPSKRPSAAEAVHAPVPYNGKALVRYKCEDKTYYFVVKNFTEQKPINLP